MTAVLELRGLVAGYGRLPAVRDLDLHVAPGEVVALLGANGAGKTTTLLTAAGVIPPLRGKVCVLGDDVTTWPAHRIARLGVAFVPEDRGVFHQLTVNENLKLARASADAMDAALAHFPALAALGSRRCGLLSGGEQQMLGLAKALATSPKLLMIDEMSLGLAPRLVERMLAVVRGIAVVQKTAVVIVEQHIGMALSVADRGYVLRNGSLVVQGAADELAQRRDVLEASYLG